MTSLLPFITALLPAIIFITIGIILKRVNFLPETGWEAVEKLIYYVLFPALLIDVIANVEYDLGTFLPMASALNIATLMMFGLSFLAWFQKTTNGPRFSSILQNNIRFNSFVALTIASQFNGGIYLSLVAIAIGMLIPTVNILSVWSLIIWGKASQKESPVEELFTNPLIIGCVIGFGIHYFNIGIHEYIAEPLDMLGHAAMPLALIAVGTGLDFERMKNTPSSRLFWALFRGCVFPILTVVCCYLFGIKDENIIFASVIVASSPTATNSYILARQMGGDAPFMASLIGTSTIFSAITMPAIIYLIFNSGLLDVAN